ncbi:MAG: allophanate hydrolase subunit 1 [Clostridiales Family XIII bacterium]|jgi:allophanate hydrolase subunit 1|nr:allophanate hydrolase subunit 1 [Clostridiales Family XIII bacterium]
MTDKYNTVLRTLDIGEDFEILFRQAGDGFMQVEYGYEQRLYLPDSFRILAVNELILNRKIKGLIETVPGLRTNMFHFDPEVLSVDALMDVVAEEEGSFKDVSELKVESRLIHLPIAFEDSQTKAAVEKYLGSIRPDAPNCENGNNLNYIAACNGVTVNDAKKMILDVEWFNSGCGFWPGGGFFWPMDPRKALVVPKYNPPRTWTPEGAVGIGGPCLFTYTTPAGGGYQLFGRTIPTFQFAMKHPQFRDNPCLYRNADRVKLHEVTEREIDEIYDHVHEKTDYVYEVEQGEISVKDYLAWLKSDEISTETEAFRRRQAEGVATAPKM